MRAPSRACFHGPMQLRLVLAALGATLTALAGAGTAAAASSRFAVQPSALPGFSGGDYTAATGELVHVFSAEEYGADPEFNQRWADFLASLPHGPELSRAIVYLAPLAQVQTVCGSAALACYDPSSETIFGTAEDVPDRATAQSILAHEYGHHVANNRSNPPWDAEDWGAKRWASYENVCSDVQDGTLFPGDEGESYQLNPGEGFAETFRVLYEREAGVPESPWLAVSQSLYPDDTALRLLEQDVRDPWTGNTVSTYPGHFSPGSGIRRTFHLKTPLDGNLRLTLRSPRTASFALRLFDAEGNLVDELVDSRPAKTMSYEICGARTLDVRVVRTQGYGAFTLQVSRP
jgi:hypothetical protein